METLLISKTTANKHPRRLALCKDCKKRRYVIKVEHINYQKGLNVARWFIHSEHSTMEDVAKAWNKKAVKTLKVNQDGESRWFSC